MIELMRKIDGIVTFTDIDEDVHEKDTVVADMTEDQKKMYTYMHNLGEVNRSTKDEKIKEQTYQEHEVLYPLFWYDIRTTYNLIGEPSIGVRKGFKIVTSLPEPWKDLATMPECIDRRKM